MFKYNNLNLYVRIRTELLVPEEIIGLSPIYV